MPEPIVEPITTAMPLQSPIFRSRPCGGVAVIRRNYATGLPPARGTGDYSAMSAPLIAALFWIAVLAAVVAQVMILRSTARVLRAVAPARPALEWSFAILPALVLVLVLALSWRATMRAPAIEVNITPAAGAVRL